MKPIKTNIKRWAIPLLGGIVTILSLSEGMAGEQMPDFSSYQTQCHPYVSMQKNINPPNIFELTTASAAYVPTCGSPIPLLPTSMYKKPLATVCKWYVNYYFVNFKYSNPAKPYKTYGPYPVSIPYNSSQCYGSPS